MTSTGIGFLLLAIVSLVPTGMVTYRNVDWYRHKPVSWVFQDLKSPSVRTSDRATRELLRRAMFGELSAASRTKLIDVAIPLVAPPTTLSAPQVWEFLRQEAVAGSITESQQKQLYPLLVGASISGRSMFIPGEIQFHIAFEDFERLPWLVQFDCVKVLLDGIEAKYTVRGRQPAEGRLSKIELLDVSAPCSELGRHTVEVTWRATFSETPSTVRRTQAANHSFQQSIKGVVYVVDVDSITRAAEPAGTVESASGQPAPRTSTSSTQP